MPQSADASASRDPLSPLTSPRANRTTPARFASVLTCGGEGPSFVYETGENRQPDVLHFESARRSDKQRRANVDLGGNFEGQILVNDLANWVRSYMCAFITAELSQRHPHILRWDL